MVDVSNDEIDLTGGAPVDEAADDALLDELRTAASVHDAVPAGVLAAARASLTWRTIDSELEELAGLAFDSSTDDARVLVRGAAPAADEQMLTFETDRVSVDLLVTVRGEGRRLMGQLAPAGVANIEVRSASGVVVTARSDELGRVPALDVPAGPLSLRIQYPGQLVAIVTDWVTV
ncbi:hypothetical protein acdb102_33710 [Acidothermaceae bacterium B102]|nr:hypothetical protein acdb102_33710 [Acidothermaceae bacterium B102]